jgi:hypothetical protein
MFYDKTPTGRFTGKLYVEWIAPNQFIYRPDADRPLVFTASDGRSLKPRPMYTDGGSIPRLFWSAPNLAPWDFGPAYVIHDWLFEQRHCKYDDWQSYDFERGAQILAEGIKTQMTSAGTEDASIVYAIYEAVRSPIAKALWEGGECKTPPAAVLQPSGAPGAPVSAPVRILTIDFK